MAMSLNVNGRKRNVGKATAIFNLTDKNRRQNKPSLPVLIMAQHAPPLPYRQITSWREWRILEQYKDLVSFIHDIWRYKNTDRHLICAASRLALAQNF